VLVPFSKGTVLDAPTAAREKQPKNKHIKIIELVSGFDKCLFCCFSPPLGAGVPWHIGVSEP